MNTKQISFSIVGLTKLNEHGQFVLPNEVRRKLDIEGEDKLAIISYVTEEGIQVLNFVKTKDLEYFCSRKQGNR